MAIFEYRCPQCNQTTLLDPNGMCHNPRGGTTCGFTFPLKSGNGNGLVRQKMNKHTTPPPSGYWGDYSWVEKSSSYPMLQMDAALSNSVNLDPQSGYLFMFTAPSGNYPLAKIMYASGTDVKSASGIVLPLNSKLNNMHIHFDNYQPHFIPVAEGPDLVIQQPNSTHPTEYHVLSGSNLIFDYDCTKNTYHKH